MSESETCQFVKKTPTEATEFEREQLRFFLTNENVAQVLDSLNPSLAWLPEFQKLGVFRTQHPLVSWIERNFDDLQAIREVAANIQFFNEDSGRLMEHNLNRHAKRLPPLVLKSWRLVIHAMKLQRSGRYFGEWFQLAAAVRSGDISPDIYERLADIVRPKLRIGKLSTLYREAIKEPGSPRDLMSISFRTDEGASSADILGAWPATGAAEFDRRLLDHLTEALKKALAEAADANLESETGFSISDSDVPSIAHHPQNDLHGGFHLPVRVIVGIWDRLLAKSTREAIACLKKWRGEPYHLFRRLALYGCTQSQVPASYGATLLTRIGPREFFLTGATVECLRLIKSRWGEFSAAKRTLVLKNIYKGPPTTHFGKGADVKRFIDRCRFDVLGEMKRNGLDIGPEGERLYKQIEKRWPRWQLRPAEQTGFHVWHGGGPERGPSVGDFTDIPDDQLIDEIERRKRPNDFMTTDVWTEICRQSPDRALRALAYLSNDERWPSSPWQTLLYCSSPFIEREANATVAQLLARMPDIVFSELMHPISSWFEDHASYLPRAELWNVWDRVAAIALTNEEVGRG